MLSVFFEVQILSDYCLILINVFALTESIFQHLFSAVNLVISAWASVL